MKDSTKEAVFELGKGKQGHPGYKEQCGQNQRNETGLDMLNLGVVREAAGKQGRSQVMEVLIHTKEFEKYYLVGKEESLKAKEMTKLVLHFRMNTLTAVSKRSWKRLEAECHYNSLGEGYQSLGQARSNEMRTRT